VTSSWSLFIQPYFCNCEWSNIL